MDIKNLEIRIYVLAGQLEEAKRIYKEAITEVNELENKKQTKSESVDTGKTVVAGEMTN